MALKIVGKVTIIEGNYFKNKSFISMVSPKHYFDKEIYSIQIGLDILKSKMMFII